MKKLFLILPLAMSILIISGLNPDKASALSGSEFQAGRIIDDGVFFNPGSMNTNDIQTFLNSKVPSCDTNGTQPHGGTTRASYGASRGYPAPYICLRNYSQSTQTKAAENGLCSQYNGGTKSAAQIIYDVGQACGINPKVMIILLEKEQSLVTDDWPWSIQYRSATGYGCPDTAACDSNYYGFFNQVYSAARQFKRYARDSTSFSYRAYRSNYIQYNPNAGCGGTNVYIQNQATASLYNYTPYQPNASALANLYGSGDGCGAYGNRNFWRLFNDWFGNVYGYPYFASFAGMSPYPNLKPGETTKLFIKYKNTGNYFWKDDASVFPGYVPTHLATTSPINRPSVFASGWLNASRPTGKFSKVFEADGVTQVNEPHTVQPGQIAMFEFNVTAPSWIQPGTYREHVQPVLEGAPNWDMGGWGYFDINVIKPVFKASYSSMSPYPSLRAGETKTIFIKYKNTGNTYWKDDVTVFSGYKATHLATTTPINRPSNFKSSGWLNVSRPDGTFNAVYETNGTTAATDQHTVQPGQIAMFQFNITAPVGMTTGTYREYLQPVLEGAKEWDMGGWGYTDITVIP